MNIGELIRRLSKHSKFDDPVRIGMWFGPGSPSAESFEITEVRVFDSNGAFIYGNDPTRVHRGSTPSTPTQAKRDAANELRRIARQLEARAQAIIEGAEVE